MCRVTPPPPTHPHSRQLLSFWLAFLYRATLDTGTLNVSVAASCLWISTSCWLERTHTSECDDQQEWSPICMHIISFSLSVSSLICPTVRFIACVNARLGIPPYLSFSLSSTFRVSIHVINRWCLRRRFRTFRSM